MSRMKSVICPNCGANLSVDENRDTFFCEYCGTQIVTNSGSLKIESTEKREIHIVDHAKIEEIKFEEKKLENDRKEFIWGIGLLLGIAVVCFWFSTICSVLGID